MVEYAGFAPVPPRPSVRTSVTRRMVVPYCGSTIEARTASAGKLPLRGRFTLSPTRPRAEHELVPEAGTNFARTHLAPLAATLQTLPAHAASPVQPAKAKLLLNGVAVRVTVPETEGAKHFVEAPAAPAGAEPQLRPPTSLVTW